MSNRVRQKHRVQFHEVVSAFDDLNGYEVPDPEGHEDRWMWIGRTAGDRVLAIITSDEDSPLHRLMQRGDFSMNTTAEVEFDYQTYMNEHAPDPRQINRGPKARQKRRKAIVYNNRGIAYMSEGEYDCAIKDFTKAIEVKPDFAEGYNNRGVAYAEKSEMESAIEDFTTVINLKSIGKSDYIEAYYNLGLTYAKHGEINLAIANFSKVVQLEPNELDIYSNRGIVYYILGDYERAINDYSKAIQIKPDDIHAYHNRGEACLHLSRWDKGREDLKIAKNKGVDIIAEFHNDYESVADFERKNGVKLPEDIAAMLTN